MNGSPQVLVALNSFTPEWVVVPKAIRWPKFVPPRLTEVVAQTATVVQYGDLAAFGQMFLNRGTYGDARILSPASVAEMTRNQIPGIGASHRDEFFPGA